MSDTTTRDPRIAEIESHRPYLVRYALAQLRDAELAQEAVQEALLAALESLDGFGGKSTLRTWLTSILRFKIADQQRRLVSERRRLESVDGEEGGDESWLDDYFDEAGHWRDAPQTWNNPDGALEQKRFWEVFERCLDKLPAAGGRVFFRREVMGEETEVICAGEGITPANCWVILHRARLALRACLEKTWFAGEADR